MKKVKLVCLTLTCLLFFSKSIFSQTLAITEHGDTIYVYNNGTWAYEPIDTESPVTELSFLESKLNIDTINEQFSFPPDANKQVKNAQGQFSIRYDDKYWKRVPPATLNDEAEFAFQSKKSDIWGIVISEETEIPADKLFRIAKKTMEENTGEKAEIIKTEVRKVNGTEVIRGVLKTNFSGITFIFDTQYFSNEKGSVQFTTWTSDKLWEKYKDKLIELQSGFIVN